MENLSDEAGPVVKNGPSMESKENQDVVAKEEAGLLSSTENESGSQAGSEASQESPPPARPRPNILMICVPGLSGDEPVIHTNSILESKAHITTFKFKPGRFLGEKGSINNLDEIVDELLNFILAAPNDIGVSLSELSIGFITADLSGMLVKKALLTALTHVKYRQIYYKVSLLVFFGTPHHSSKIFSWETTIYTIIEDMYRGVMGCWLPDRIHQLSCYLERLQLDFDNISDEFKIVNYFQDLPESSPEFPIVHKSCAELRGFNVTNIGVNLTHYELHSFVHDSPGEDFLMDRVSDTLIYSHWAFCQLVAFLSVEADRIETHFQKPGYLNNLADYIIHSKELVPSISDDQGQLISLELEVEVDGKQFLSCFRDAILRNIPPYPGGVIACTTITATQPNSLTEIAGLLSSCLVQILKQRPGSSLRPEISDVRVFYAMEISDPELKVRTLCECLKLVFSHTSDCQGFWLIHTTGAPEQHRLLLELVKQLQFMNELDETSWKVVIIGNSAANVDFPPSKILSRVKLGQDTLRSSVEKDIKSQLDDIIRSRPSISNVKETTLQLFNKQPSNHKLLSIYMDALSLVHPPVPAILANLADSFSSTHMAYCAIFEQVPKHFRTWVRDVLGFVCFSFRPMTLNELAVAVAAVDCQNVEQLVQNLDCQAGFHIREILPGIVRVESKKIYVAHDNLKSFLQRSPDDAWYHLGDCHTKIALTSYNYLSLLLDKLGNAEPSPMRTIVDWTYSTRALPGQLRDSRIDDPSLRFTAYAALYWYDHYLSAKRDGSMSQQSGPWLVEPRRLKDILSLRNNSRSQHRLGFRAPEKFMPLNLRERLNLSELDAFEMTVQLVDREPNSAYIDLMYPPDPSTSETVPDWIVSNFPQMNVTDILIRHPQVLDRLFQFDKHTLFSNASDILLFIVARKDLPLLLNALGKLHEQVNLREMSLKALTYAVCWNFVDIVKTLLDYQEIPLGAGTRNLTLLRTAVTTGSVKMVQLLLEAGIDVNIEGTEGFLDDHDTPLHVACQFGLIEIVDLLLNAGADANLRSDNGVTPLHVACSHGFPSICKLLVEHGARFVVDANGNTPLHIAVRYSGRPRYRKVVITLVEDLKKKFPAYKEANSSDAEQVLTIVNAQGGTKKKTALIYAAVTGNLDLAKSLIELGADVHAAEDEGYNALCRATMMGDLDMARFLLDNGSQVDYTRSDGRQPLHDACSWGMQNLIEELVERGASVDYLDEDEMPPIAVAAEWGITRAVKQMIPLCSKESLSISLSHAARFGYHKIVTALLDAEADINHQDDYGNTALQFSAWSSNSRVTQLLLLRFPDINRTDNDNITALADAARRGAVECLKLLLDAGADTEIEAASGKRPLIRAAMADDECFRMLLERGAEAVLPADFRNPGSSIFKNGLSFLGSLANDCSLNSVKIYLEHLKPRISEDAFSSEINEALAAAAYGSRLDTLQILLEYGADPNAITAKFDSKFGSAIGIAVAFDRINAVQLLLDNKITPVDLNKVDDYRDTPLHIALDWCVDSVQKEMVELLLAHGADPTISSGTYGTVLNATSETRHQDVFEKILNLPGVSRDTPDDLGRLPLHLAAARKSDEERIRSFITEKSTFRSVDKQGRNALHHAAAGGWEDTVTIILKDCPDLINVPDRHGWTPLHWACRKGSVFFVDDLISRGANEKAKTHDRWTPRHVAIYHGMMYGNLTEDQLDDDASDNEELPSKAAEKVTDDNCDSCFCSIYGTGYRCGTCPKYWFCFKCYWTAEETHPKEHVFQRFDQETHEIETPPGSEAEAWNEMHSRQQWGENATI
ncbi:ankyrin repeat-containing domain protein [Hypoxylon sp. NC0597]|nr:ankyrin repeat-containing domain protein [Hypoxylon sp. NC0597]